MCYLCPLPTTLEPEGVHLVLPSDTWLLRQGTEWKAWVTDWRRPSLFCLFPHL